ncbi:hypothetical protein DAPPUDRAFT_232780 [Daphnia pulex]|uniref:K Homology domain-containing protein n=1 Tax=Daphnia pulex TaxID=6669 RepID=E9FSC5_DAPPU|nr:hypothetical protein DAPPUDRAFT_232780 [Daphnia pulex]|eukprot:EFX89187.1 hypothetical protein DAPPUDRAFT_232780 [Daphnia pulex]
MNNVRCTLNRMTESQTRHSAVNLNNIEPDVACSNQHALPRPVINDGFSTTSGEDLNNQSFLRLMDEKNLIELDKERIANELSLVQTQLTDSHSKLRQFRIESATTKSKLEKQKRFITDITVKNIRLTNEDSRLRRKVEDSDRLIASSRAKIEELHNRLAEQKLDKVNEDLATAKRELELRNRAVTRLEKKTFRLMRNDKRLRRKMKNTNSLLLSGQAESERLRTSLAEQQLDTREFAVATRELESKNTTISELETENLRLAENDSQLRRKIEDRDRIIASSATEKNLIVLDKECLENELSLLQSQLTDSSSKLQMFQNVHDELAATKSELEETKSLISANTGENLHLTNENSGLRRKIEAKDRLIASCRAKLQKLHNSLEEKKLDNIHNELLVSKRNIKELITKNLRLTESDSQLRRKLEDADCLVLSSKMALEELQLSLNKQTKRVNQLVDQMRTLDQEKDEAVRKLTELQQKQIQPKMTTDVGCGNDEIFHQVEEPIPAVTEITEIVTAFLASGLKPQADSSITATAEPQPVNLSESLPSVFHQIEEPIRPSYEITDVVTAFLASGCTKTQAKSPVTVPQQAHQPFTTDVLKNSPARNAVEKKAVQVSTQQPSAVLPEFYIKSTIEKEVDVDQIVVFGISNTDCGKVVGRNGSNAKRIEEEYGVGLSFVTGELLITGGDANRRLAACSDVCEKLTVTLECPNLDLRNNYYSNDYLLRKLSFDNYLSNN